MTQQNLSNLVERFLHLSFSGHRPYKVFHMRWSLAHALQALAHCGAPGPRRIDGVMDIRTSL